MSEEIAKKSGKSGKHAGDRMLVTLDKKIYETFVNMAELEGLPPATKARQILTMYVNNVALVPREQTIVQPKKTEPDVPDTPPTNKKTDESDFVIVQDKPTVAGLKRNK